MSLLQIELRGMPEFEAAMQKLGGGLAQQIAQQTINRIGPSVARQVAQEVASLLPVDPKLIRQRIYWIQASAHGHGLLRFRGTGKGGSGFVRPRHLGLALQTVGRFTNGVVKLGRPTTSVPEERNYPHGFVMVPGRGAKQSARWKNTSNLTGRNLKPWKGGAAGRTKATLFRRTTGDKYPIAQVPGLRLSEAVPLAPIIESARMLIVLRTQIELTRRLAVELNRHARR